MTREGLNRALIDRHGDGCSGMSKFDVAGAHGDSL
jgi:hypothetical protein